MKKNSIIHLAALPLICLGSLVSFGCGNDSGTEDGQSDTTDTMAIQSDTSITATMAGDMDTTATMIPCEPGTLPAECNPPCADKATCYQKAKACHLIEDSKIKSYTDRLDGPAFEPSHQKLGEVVNTASCDDLFAVMLKGSERTGYTLVFALNPTQGRGTLDVSYPAALIQAIIAPKPSLIQFYCVKKTSKYPADIIIKMGPKEYYNLSAPPVLNETAFEKVKQEHQEATFYDVATEPSLRLQN